eukprot:TRINITY_DN3796_c1_g1_i1.p1 TRINITY_DN3796_c1_g1~~TRINITY_DN3796_c1_g1_i1.p1  ORF type:complete len:77 (+),score=7.00 TRINITY_DN3796_c1_g1_i1:146-376(+)
MYRTFFIENGFFSIYNYCESFYIHITAVLDRGTFTKLKKFSTNLFARKMTCESLIQNRENSVFSKNFFSQFSKIQE